MRKLICILATFFFYVVPPCSATEDSTLLTIGQNQFIGTIGKYPIRMTLYYDANGNLDGTYYYVEHADQKLYLKGKIFDNDSSTDEDHDNLELQEFVSPPKSGAVASASFEGEDNDLNGFTGTWKTADGKREISFKLKFAGPDKVGLSGSYSCCDQDSLTIAVYGDSIKFEISNVSGGPAHDLCDGDGSAKLVPGTRARYEDHKLDDVDGADITFDFSTPDQCVISTDFHSVYAPLCGPSVGFDNTYFRDGSKIAEQESRKLERAEEEHDKEFQEGDFELPDCSGFDNAQKKAALLRSSPDPDDTDNIVGHNVAGMRCKIYTNRNDSVPTASMCGSVVKIFKGDILRGIWTDLSIKQVNEARFSRDGKYLWINADEEFIVLNNEASEIARVATSTFCNCPTGRCQAG